VSCRECGCSSLTRACSCNPKCRNLCSACAGTDGHERKEAIRRENERTRRVWEPLGLPKPPLW